MRASSNANGVNDVYRASKAALNQAMASHAGRHPERATILMAMSRSWITLANRTPYGLSASICTRDLEAAFAFVERIDAGMVHVNRPTPGADPHLPFGGVKGSTASGHREQGQAAIEFFTEGQTVYLQHAVPVSA